MALTKISIQGLFIYIVALNFSFALLPYPPFGQNLLCRFTRGKCANRQQSNNAYRSVAVNRLSPAYSPVARYPSAPAYRPVPRFKSARVYSPASGYPSVSGYPPFVLKALPQIYTPQEHLHLSKETAKSPIHGTYSKKVLNVPERIAPFVIASIGQNFFTDKADKDDKGVTSGYGDGGYVDTNEDRYGDDEDDDNEKDEDDNNEKDEDENYGYDENDNCKDSLDLNGYFDGEDIEDDEDEKDCDDEDENDCEDENEYCGGDEEENHGDTEYDNERDILDSDGYFEGEDIEEDEDENDIDDEGEYCGGDEEENHGDDEDNKYGNDGEEAKHLVASEGANDTLDEEAIEENIEEIKGEDMKGKNDGGNDGRDATQEANIDSSESAVTGGFGDSSEDRSTEDEIKDIAGSTEGNNVDNIEQTVGAAETIIWKVSDAIGTIVDDTGTVIGKVTDVNGIVENKAGVVIGRINDLTGKVVGDNGTVIGRVIDLKGTVVDPTNDVIGKVAALTATFQDTFGDILGKIDFLLGTILGSSGNLIGKVTNFMNAIIDTESGTKGGSESIVTGGSGNNWEDGSKEDETKNIAGSTEGNNVDNIEQTVGAAKTIIGKVSDATGTIVDGIGTVIGKVTDVTGVVKNRVGIVIGTVNDLTGNVVGVNGTVIGRVMDLKGTVVDPTSDVIGKVAALTATFQDTSGDILGIIDCLRGTVLSFSGKVIGKVKHFMRVVIDTVSGDNGGSESVVTGDAGDSSVDRNTEDETKDIAGSTEGNNVVNIEQTVGAAKTIVGKVSDSTGNIVDDTGTVIGKVTDVNGIVENKAGVIIGRINDLTWNVVDIINGNVIGKVIDLKGTVAGPTNIVIGKIKDLTATVHDTTGATLGNINDISGIVTDVFGNVLGALNIFYRFANYMTEAVTGTAESNIGKDTVVTADIAGSSGETTDVTKKFMQIVTDAPFTAGVGSGIMTNVGGNVVSKLDDSNLVTVDTIQNAIHAGTGKVNDAASSLMEHAAEKLVEDIMDPNKVGAIEELQKYFDQ